MYDVWASGTYDARDFKLARGTWLCPSLGVYSLTRRAKTVDMDDGLRIGCMVAALSTSNPLGEGLTTRMPKYPAPRWAASLKWPIPLPNLMYWILYKTEVHPRIGDHSIVMAQSDGEYYDRQPSALLIRREVPKACTL